MLKIGEIIPDLELDTYQNDKSFKLKLHSLKGKWQIYIFYPGDFTFVCPTELEDATKLYAEFQKENAEVLSVSTDSVHVHKAWHDQSPAIKNVTFPMIADPTGRMCRAFGTYIEEGVDEGLSLRGTFVVNPDLQLIAYEMHHNDVGRSAKEALRKLRAAKFVAEHPGKVCPASWEPGADTLTPGLDLVGKI